LKYTLNAFSDDVSLRAELGIGFMIQ